MLALIPALLEHNLITVLILPLKSLITDYKRKLEKMNLPFLHYTGRDVPRGYCTANLVLVSVDMAREEHWKQWIAEVDLSKYVERFCFDEGHYPLTDTKFRESVRDIFMVRSLPRQLVVYSGTISPTCEPSIKAMFMLRDNVQVFRSPSTNRPEFQLIKAAPHTKFNIASVVNELWNLHSSKFTPEERALVFVPYIDLGHSIATMLDCEFYNSQDADDVKESIYDRWHQGLQKVMVSTSAFSCGNDYAHIPLIIHAGTPREMIRYIQEISRGGRNKKQTFCYLLPIAKWSSASATELDALLGVKEMAEICFGSNNTCIRYTITKYNDGHGVYCGDDENDFPCSNCLPTAGLMPTLFTSHVNPLKRKTNTVLIPEKHPKIIRFDNAPTTARRPMSASMKETWDKIEKAKQDKAAQEAEVLGNVEVALNFLFGDCSMCFCTSQFTNTVYLKKQHAFKQCRFHQLQSGLDYINFKNLINYNGRIHQKICYICHVPNFGDRLHQPFDNRPSGCHYLDIILPTLYCGFIYKKPELEKEFGTTWGRIEQYAHWLCGQLVKPKEKSNLVSAFLVISRLVS